MTSNKTRCFQVARFWRHLEKRLVKVVPVPGVFNRGRWECWDYKEGEDQSETKENDTLTLEKNSASVPTNSTTTNVSSEAINVVAIDNKIEQAMDLVKTHLTFAVREQVENLRSRIMELESKVMHLEAENSILKDHVPSDVLQSLSLQSTSTNHRSNNTS